MDIARQPVVGGPGRPGTGQFESEAEPEQSTDETVPQGDLARRRDLQLADRGLDRDREGEGGIDLSRYIALLSERYRGCGPVMALLRGVLFGTWSNLVSAVSDRPTSSSLYLFRKAAV